MNLKSLKIEVRKEINKAKNLKELDEIFRIYLGKKGEVTKAFGLMKGMSEKERVKFGKELNELKKFIEKEIETKKQKLPDTGYPAGEQAPYGAGKIQDIKIDVTVPGKKLALGHLHPLTVATRRAIEIFESMGFSVVEGPEIENEFYNFDALNMPADHPARDMQDTFWLKRDAGHGLLMRTQTSAVQVRYMEKNNPPLRIITPGKVFRNEATDAGHDLEFYQIEGLMIDKKISAANFKAVIKEFFSRFFNKEVNLRLRPSYFPFVKPGFEVDISCLNCNGKGCSICKRTGWVEIMGAGMVHPNVFKNAGLNPRDWQGFAFGFGWDRIVMMKYKINDIRLFRSGDLRFLKQF